MAFSHVAGAMMRLRHGLDVKWEDEFGFDHLDSALLMKQYRIVELFDCQGSKSLANWHCWQPSGTLLHPRERFGKEVPQ